MTPRSPQSKYVLLQTDLFQIEQPDEDLDKWFVGGDCAGWFYARLLPQSGIVQHCDPVMEDWGWTMAVAVSTIPVWINIWQYFDIEHAWLLGVEARKRFFSRTSQQALAKAESLVGDALEAIISGDARFMAHKWYAENPFEVPITSLN